MEDMERNWISHTHIFQVAVTNVGNNSAEWNEIFSKFSGENKYEEIYADLYFLRLENPNLIPLELEMFYIDP